MTQTPNANRLHIAIAGDRNAGKSTLFNALLGQDAALVSPTPGTTTDVVSRAMEIHGLGPIYLMDTAGWDDTGELGEARVHKTKEALIKADMAIIVTRDQTPPPADLLQHLNQTNTPYFIFNNITNQPLSAVNCQLSIIKYAPKAQEPSLTAHLTNPNDIVVLVMPQDSQAPKGRLILPQQQVIRDLLDNGCIAVTATPETLTATLNALQSPPNLVITDSQVFAQVNAQLNLKQRLTSFSILMARAKGDIDVFLNGAKAIDTLTPGDNILIAESCTHNPQDGDIGRVKIPALLNKHVGGQLNYDFAAGSDFPDDLTKYKLVIQCGGCMFNRKHMLNRLSTLTAAKTPVTNYGITLAKMQGILNRVEV